MIGALRCGDQVREIVRRTRDQAAAIFRRRVTPHVATPGDTRQARVEQQHVEYCSATFAGFLEAKLHRKQRITRPVQRDECAELRRERLAEPAVGATAREWS